MELFENWKKEPVIIRVISQDDSHYLCDIILEKSVLQSSNVLSVYICK